VEDRVDTRECPLQRATIKHIRGHEFDVETIKTRTTTQVDNANDVASAEQCPHEGCSQMPRTPGDCNDHMPAPTGERPGYDGPDGWVRPRR